MSWVGLSFGNLAKEILPLNAMLRNLQDCGGNKDVCVYVAVQFYPWFKFYFPLFLTHYHKLPYTQTKEIKIEPQHLYVKLVTHHFRQATTVK